MNCTTSLSATCFDFFIFNEADLKSVNVVRVRARREEQIKKMAVGRLCIFAYW